MDENPTTSSQPPNPQKTRRRLYDYENENEDGVVNIHHSRHHHHNHHQSPIGCFTMLKRRIKSLLRYSVWGRKSISLWVLVFMVLLATSTISIKIMLMMNTIDIPEEEDEDLEDIDSEEFNDFHRKPEPLETTSFQSERTGFLLHGGQSSHEEKMQELWKKPRSDSFYTCPYIPRKKRGNSTHSNGYILIHANGGLNQMKAGIADMVAVAKIMDAVLILPALDHTSYWSDPSEFKEIFDWKHFIEALKDDVQVLESLPPSLAKVKPFNKVPISWSKASYYRDLVPLLKRHRVIKFTHTDSRLANNALMHPIQRLRCHAMYEALRFSSDIQELAQKLIHKLRQLDNHYVALHLRYEKDMLAFTGCDHHLSKKEREELQKLRYETKHWKKKRINGTEHRLHGDCPMTPKEAAMFLQALGFSSNTTIYISSGEIYGQNGISEFKKKFPKTFSHWSFASDEEPEKDLLAPFLGHHNKLAALDYIVAVESDAFTYTYYGNMAKAVRGHRMFLDYRKTIDPDMARFIRLVDEFDKGLISQEDFSSRVKRMHNNRIGGPSYRQARKPPRHEEPFFANPYPGCICEG